MAYLTVSGMKRIAPRGKPAVLKAFVKVFNEEARQWGIVTNMAACHFIAQCAVETQGFRKLEESLRYSPKRLRQVFPKYVKSIADARALIQRGPAAVANRVYNGRMNNRPGSNDGWDFRGAGITHLTGRYNFTQASEALGFDYVNKPELARDPGHATRIALWYWKDRRGLIRAANANKIRLVTKLVNGGYNGLAQRKRYFRLAFAVYGHATDAPEVKRPSKQKKAAVALTTASTATGFGTLAESTGLLDKAQEYLPYLQDVSVFVADASPYIIGIACVAAAGLGIWWYLDRDKYQEAFGD